MNLKHCMRSALVLICNVYLALCLVPTVQASYSPAIDLTFVGPFVGGISVDSVIGWEFDINFPLQVSALGFWDRNRDGLAASHEIGLWDSSENLLTSTTIPAGTAAVEIDEFRYVSIEPIQLQVGTTYYIAALNSASLFDPYVGGASATVFSSHPGINWIQRRQTISSTLQFPSEIVGQSGSFGPNMLLTTIPEPTTSALAIAALCLAMGRRRRRLAADNFVFRKLAACNFGDSFDL